MKGFYLRTLWLLAGRSDESEKGASLVEYALLIALIAIVCFTAVGALGGEVEKPLSSFGSQLDR